MTTADGTALSNALARAMLSRFPLIDGHNDLPWAIRENIGDLDAVDLTQRVGKTHTDIPRLVEGGVGGQFWSVFVPPSLPGAAAVQATLEQIDLVKRLAARYPAELGMAYSAADVRRLHREGRIASLIGVEGGHSINDSLAVLRSCTRSARAT